MEFEFDKEIDAILRKARESEFVFATNPKSTIQNSQSSHLDADEISAFAENALPEKSKRLYTEHFAECDRCRRILSNLIVLNVEAGTISASLPGVETVAEIPIPWYRKLFAMPNLAYTMGAFVLVFGGFLGLLVLQNFNNQENTLSQASEPQQKERGPNDDQDTGFSAANTNSVMSNSAAMTANTAGNFDNTAANTSAISNTAATTASNQTSTNSVAIAPREADSLSKEKLGENQPIVSATPPPLAQGEPMRDDKTKDDRELRERTEAADAAAPPPPLPPPASATRMEAPKPQKKVAEEEIKSSAARSNTTANKRIGGKTFERRSTVWIDSDYRENILLRHISRGSNDYKKLDREVRNIAENLDGTVIVVWKAKGYRIQ